MMSKNSHNLNGTRREDWRTPPELIEEVENAIGSKFGVDLAASPQNCITPFYIDEAQDFLSVDLMNYCEPHRWAWCNPPYKKGGKEMGRWAEKLMTIPNVVCLVPASVGARWFQPFWTHSTFIVLFRKRLKFWNPECPDAVSAQFDSALVVKSRDYHLYPPDWSHLGNVVKPVESFRE
jgi:hypothetical protein